MRLGERVQSVGRSGRPIGRTLALSWLVIVASAALLAPLLPIASPTEGTGAFAASPGSDHLLGTDRLGRDILARVVFGARASLQITVVVVVTAMLVGLVLGMLSAYFRGVVDVTISALVDVLLCLPGLVVLLVLVSFRGATMSVLIVGMSALIMPSFVRVARANAMRFVQQDFVRASVGLGAPWVRVLAKDLLPNVLPPVRVYAMAASAQVLVAEGSLSFLGLGVPPPTPSWGGMIADGRSLMAYDPHIVVIPSIALLITVVALNRLGDRAAFSARHET